MSIVNAGLSILVLIVMVYLRLWENRKYRAMNLRQEIMSRQIEVLTLRVYGENPLTPPAGLARAAELGDVWQARLAESDPDSCRRDPS